MDGVGLGIVCHAAITMAFAAPAGEITEAHSAGSLAFGFFP
jgi:hypothetical protein